MSSRIGYCRICERGKSISRFEMPDGKEIEVCEPCRKNLEISIEQNNSLKEDKPFYYTYGMSGDGMDLFGGHVKILAKDMGDARIKYEEYFGKHGSFLGFSFDYSLERWMETINRGLIGFNAPCWLTLGGEEEFGSWEDEDILKFMRIEDDHALYLVTKTIHDSGSVYNQNEVLVFRLDDHKSNQCQVGYEEICMETYRLAKEWCQDGTDCE